MDLKLSKNVRRMVKRHFAFRLAHKSVFQEDTTLGELPSNLRTSVVWYLYRACIPKLPLWCKMEQEFHGAVAWIVAL